jgi:AcrR family transcriptional regulator
MQGQALTRRRWTADERRPVIVNAAIEEFGEAGLAGASTEAIARRAGISHGYLFRLFRTKRELFIAAVERAFGQVIEAFEEAERTRGAAPAFKAYGRAYRALLDESKHLHFAFHAYAACADPDIQAVVRREYMNVFHWVRRTTGASADRTRLFMATGLLMSVGTVIGDPGLSPDGSWSRRVLRERD